MKESVELMINDLFLYMQEQEKKEDEIWAQELIESLNLTDKEVK